MSDKRERCEGRSHDCRHSEGIRLTDQPRTCLLGVLYIENLSSKCREETRGAPDNPAPMKAGDCCIVKRTVWLVKGNCANPSGMSLGKEARRRNKKPPISVKGLNNPGAFDGDAGCLQARIRVRGSNGGNHRGVGESASEHRTGFMTRSMRVNEYVVI